VAMALKIFTELVFGKMSDILSKLEVRQLTNGLEFAILKQKHELNNDYLIISMDPALCVF
jgi:hypothetical protein